MDNDSFLNIDRLVEFGLGMAVAQQMVKTFNSTMGAACTTSPQLPQQASTQRYYVAIDGKQVGPMNERELMQLVQNNVVNKDTLSWIPGMMAWQPIASVPEILKIIALTPPQLPTL